MKNHRDPETKEALLDRLLMADYNGDIRQLGAAPATIKRIAPHMLRLEFPDTGTIYDLTVHRPRKPEKALARTREGRSFNRAADEWSVEPEAPQPQKRRRHRAPARGDARG